MPRAAGGAVLRDAAPARVGPRRAGHAPVVQRALRGDAHRLGRGLQPLARHRGDPLARGRDVRRLGLVRLPARHRQRRRVVAQRAAPGGRRRRLRRGVRRRPCRIHPCRRPACHRHGSAGVGRGRRRGAARVACQQRPERARDRAHFLLRAGARDGCRRQRAPGFFQAVRPDRVPAGVRRAAREPPAALARGGAAVGRAFRGGGGRGHGGHPVRIGPGALPGARRQCGRCGGDAGRLAAVQHRGHRARPGVLAAPAGAHRAGQVGARGLLDPGCAVACRAAASGRQAPRPQCLRPRQDPGVDAGPGAAAPHRREGRGGGGFPAAGRAHPVCRPGLSRVVGSDRARRRPAVGPLGPFDFGRPADRAAAHRRGGGHRAGAPAAARARVLADEAARGGSRDRERACRLVCSGLADRHRHGGAQQPGPAAPGRRTGEGLGVRAARRPHERASARLAAIRGAGRTDRAARDDRGPAGSGAARARARAARAPRRPRRKRSRRGPAGAPPPGILQRPGRLRPGRHRIRHGAGCGSHHARALDQRDRQCGLRLPGVGRGQRLYLGGQQPREPAHALVERPGARPGRRGAVRPRRGKRRSVDRHGAADTRRGQLHRAPRPRLQPLRARGPRHRPRADCSTFPSPTP